MKVILYIPTGEYLRWCITDANNFKWNIDYTSLGLVTEHNLSIFSTIEGLLSRIIIDPLGSIFTDLNKIKTPVYREDFEIIEIEELPNV